MSRRTKWIVIGVASFLLLAAGVAVLAIVVHISPRRLPLEFNPDLPGDMTPGKEYKFDANLLEERHTISHWFTFDVNSLGFRGPEVDLEDAGWTVLVLGDGFAFGYGINQGEPFAPQLEISLRERFPALKAVVLNAGVPGYTITDQFSYMQEKGHKLEPDLLVIIVAEDDVWQVERPFQVRQLTRRIAEHRIYGFELLFWKITGQAYFIIEHDADSGGNERIRHYLKLLDRYMEVLGELQTLVDGWGGKVLLIVEKAEYPGFEKTLRKAGIPLIVVDRAIPGLDGSTGRSGEHFSPDGHWSAKTNHELAQFVAGWLAEQGMLPSP